ncbi:MAG: N-acetylmuramoyl-L-alanine amidase [Bacteroidales bacterium]|nr:N-acetylmuramoyl-L-alanine amidase [Bacteroidales bacterium]MBD5259156.1 N-acetylmuramoyl-L-alanine amidase [Barnesiella sp.]
MFRLKYILPLLLIVVCCINAAAKQFVVVIDPGHGGKDYGAVGAVTNEKTINLNVAKKLGEKIRESYGKDDVKIVYTRDKDVFIPLNDRARIANNAKGDLFISIHVNSVDKKNKRRTTIAGTEVYTCGLHRSESNLEVAKRENAVMYLEEDYSQKYQGFDPNSAESYIAFELNQSRHLDRSIEFATLAKDYLTTTADRVDIGVKQAGFWVLWATSMPAVLVELDFICNPTSEKFMASADGVDKMASSLFQAFDDYYSVVNGTGASLLGKGRGVQKAAKPKRQVVAADVSRREEPAHEVASDAAGGIEYRVQVMANDRALPANSSRFKGEAVSEYYDRGMYKYTVGHFKSRNEAVECMRRMRAKFPQAFVVKMEDGRRVDD